VATESKLRGSAARIVPFTISVGTWKEYTDASVSTRPMYLSTSRRISEPPEGKTRLKQTAAIARSLSPDESGTAAARVACSARIPLQGAPLFRCSSSIRLAVSLARVSVEADMASRRYPSLLVPTSPASAPVGADGLSARERTGPRSGKAYAS